MWNSPTPLTCCDLRFKFTNESTCSKQTNKSDFDIRLKHSNKIAYTMTWDLTSWYMWILKISALMGHVSIHERAGHGLDLYKGGVEPKTLHQVW